MFFQGTSTHTVGFSRHCSVATQPIKGPLQELQDTPSSTRDFAGATGTPLLRHPEHSFPPISFASGLKEHFITLFLSLSSTTDTTPAAPLCYQNLDTCTQYNYLLSKHLRSELFKNILYALFIGL